MDALRNRDYIGYEYKELAVEAGMVSQYLDGYLNFGWMPDDHQPEPELTNKGTIVLRLKRDRRIINKTELTRLQRNFEDCMKQITGLEQSKSSAATAVTLLIGILGTAFMAGATFAAVHEPPVVWLCILLAVPGFAGWILPYFVHSHLIRKRVQVITPLIEDKYDEIDKICEKGNHLLGNKI